jgi:cytochrome c553
MQPIAEQLSNEDIRNLAAISPRCRQPRRQNPTNPLKRTQAQKRGGTQLRVMPHRFAGTKGTARIAGQRGDYLVKALHDYKSAARSGSGVAAIASVAYSLSDDEISALAHYLAHL